MFKQYRKLFVILVIALFLTACGGGGTSLLVALSEDAAMNTDSPEDTSDEDTDKPDSSDTSETQDSDGDGVGDNSDAFPNDATETLDSDSDGIGDNSDAFPNDASESLDSDADGTGDNADAFPNDASETLDTDGDGVGDNNDAFPENPSEAVDIDSDGIGDNSDAFPNDASETLDSDKDGVGDNSDAFPNDPLETQDTDNDGTGDNTDAFPNDASETLDTDGDGVGDNSDAFPDDATETQDTDNDGVGDNSDVFPDDPSEALDSDGDGIGDNSDAFPNDASETLDSDGDGVGDNSDAFPHDPLETVDTDNDGVGDNSDAFPDDATETQDTDNDGVGDNSDVFLDDPSEALDSDGDGTADVSDAFPNDPAENKDHDRDGVGNNSDEFPYDASEQSDSDGDGIGDNSDEFENRVIRGNLFDGLDVSLRAHQSGFPVGGVPAERVINYLKAHASGGPWLVHGGIIGPDATYYGDPGLVRFATPPTVSLAQGADDRDRAIFHHAVSLMNRALPYDQHLIIDPTEKIYNIEDPFEAIPDGEIAVAFISGPLPGDQYGAAGQARSDVWYVYDAELDRSKKLRRAAAVELEDVLIYSDQSEVTDLVHELLHAVGFGGHISYDDFPDSQMNDTFRGDLDGSLPAIDAAALQALYTRLGEQLEENDLSPHSLGDWSRETIHLDGRIATKHSSGSVGRIKFGVSHNNGISMPWTRGIDPGRALADNLNQGTASWTGGLLGYTPELQPVGGKAEISVDFDTMNGSANFTELQVWPVGTLPGRLGTGLIWNTGELEYDITVGGYLFYSTGGDDGTVNGQFYGEYHEGVAGSLERQDLTAAFGAVGSH